MSASDKNSGNREISLIPILDLCAASPLAEEFKAQRGEDLVIDASQVERIGAQCMQVLLSATNTWEADGNKLTIANVTPVFSETTSELGVHFQTYAVNEEETCQ
ncbi:MAG: STAS domain-containing protein [Alphaproteobacteria bacterium]|nr:STAS domain-containing protein [Alphaproteobacteria bacterium]